MGKKENLQKAIAVSMMMTNIFCTPVWADPVEGTPGTDGAAIVHNDDISSGINTVYTADNGTDGGNASGGGKGGDGGSGGSVTVNDTVSGSIGGPIAITATGGNGALGGAGNPTGSWYADDGPHGDTGAGGDSKVVINVTGSGITTSDSISVTAQAGSGYTGYDDYTRNSSIDGSVADNGGMAVAIGLQADNKGTQAAIAAADVTISAVGGEGGHGGSSYHNGGVGGIGGAAQAYGLKAATSLLSLDIQDIEVTATGGKGGRGGSGGESGNVGDGNAAGVGGKAAAWGIEAVDSNISGAVNSIHVLAEGGAGAMGGYASNDGKTGLSSAGGVGMAYAVSSDYSTVDLTVTTAITAAATGGAGGNGVYGAGADSRKGVGAAGGAGSDGGAAVAYDLHLTAAGNVSVMADSLVSTAAGGNGGNGGDGGGPGRDNVGDKGGDGGNGGHGGNAAAYAVYADGSRLQLATGSITATATAGSGGTAGAGATQTSSYGSPLINATAGVDGTAGTAGTAKAYGIYATGSTVELKHSTPGSTITIGATATGTDSEAYAVYAADSNVILQDKINITSGTTFLHNSTVAFNDRTADRTLTSSGELKLAGSNEFRVTTDLTNNAADKFTFARLADGSSIETQYITVGYDKAFDGSDLTSISGDAVVLTVTDRNGQNLENFAGKTSTLDSPLHRFTATPTVEVNDSDVKITQIDFGRNDDASETVMTASDAQMALGSMWRIEGNNLMKRMGDLRNDKEAAKGGVWARYYRGEMSADSAYGRSFDQDYTAFQGGIDKVQDYKGGKLYTGIAVNRIDGSAGYNSGSGDMSSTGVGVYASWLGTRGHYFDVIARGSKLANDFKLVDLSGNAAKADYDTWAYGISAEYGYRQDLNAGWFVEPQAELSLGHIGSVDYTTSNDVMIRQDSVNSAVVRLGFLGGKEFTIGGSASNAYVKASALHDFGGNGGATGYYENSRLALQTGDLTGTWYEIGLGANLGIAKNSNLYFDALKTFGGDLRTDWQFNAGLRFTF